MLRCTQHDSPGLFTGKAAALVDPFRVFRSFPPFVVQSVLLLLPWLLLWRLWTPLAADRQVFAYGDFVEQF